jgi:diguanylate cyclase (GGDEF)-like protein
MTSTATDTPRILVIDDTESIHQDFRKTLSAPDAAPDLDAEERALFGAEPGAPPRPAFAIDTALQGQEGFAKVRQAVRDGRPYALAFVDMRMPPGWDGVQTIEHLWQEDPNLEVVICTAYSDYSWDRIVQRLGINDRLLILKKPFDNAEVTQLATALTRKWHLSRQATLKLDELERLVQQRTSQLRHEALHDKLTGLPNRVQLHERLEQAIARRRATGEAFAVLFVDFDRFKIVNDSLGHGIGDKLLTTVAQRLTGSLEGWAGAGDRPRNWMAARLGGDEFVILLESLPGLETACHLADRLLGDLRATYNLDGYDVCTSASIGITTSDLAYDTPHQVLRDADAAMYRAKASGRDRYVEFDQSMHQQAVARLKLETDLRKAIERREFFLHYQPIVATESGHIVGVEALVRWQHPEQGLIVPDNFISVAEETGLIVPIGQWVMRTAVEQLCRWHARHPRAADLYLSVNLSKQQLLDPALVRQVEQLVGAAALDPAKLYLEVTESTVMEKPELVTEILRNLKTLGVRLSMDDFGTGHSSLNCLHKFPIDVLKIDRAFILNLDHSLQYAAVVQAIVTLASNLHMSVTAEGIETLGHLAQIQALDCPCGQGYLFARPLAPEGIDAILAADRPLGHDAAPRV